MIKMSQGEKGESGNRRIKEEELKDLFVGIMEGYNDSAILPLSYFSAPQIPNNEENSQNSRKMQKTESERKQSERRRRDQMSEKFSLLQSMVPSLLTAHKPSKERIVDDTLNYIKYLQEEAERLEGLKKLQSKLQKVERPTLSKCTNRNSVNVAISDSAAFLAIQLPSRRGSVLGILRVLERHQAEVMEARIDVSDEKVMTFTATVRLGGDGGSSIDMIRQDILTSLDLSY
ncbi:transcription factor TT8-like [Salvia miltiorrhiza]|uniref:transcription factor TT8-like n=1 Tax=Salvia miltiorrhiza TaxID=226208 RepID=UPI0025ACC93F|nr:transcription factor TT8-like [Salvia miltiorrhiza]